MITIEEQIAFCDTLLGIWNGKTAAHLNRQQMYRAIKQSLTDRLHPSSPIETKQASEGKWRVSKNNYTADDWDMCLINGELVLYAHDNKTRTELKAIASTLNGEGGDQE